MGKLTSTLLSFFIKDDSSKPIKILKLMQDGEYYSNIDLSNIVGWRFGGYLHVLKKKGVVFSKKKGSKTEAEYVEYWKIESIPSSLDYSGKNLKTKKNINL